MVFVINHRSHRDYILVAFLAAEKTALSYAVGGWAKSWPLQTLIRAMGATVYVTTKSRVETILNALEMLKIRRLVVESEGTYQAAPGEDDILTYYANSIVHSMPSMTASYETTPAAVLESA